MSWVERHLVREALAELADASFQQRVWLAQGGPEVGSVVEAMSQLLDDSGLGDAIDAGGEPVFSAEVDELLAALEVKLRPLASGSRSPSEILADPRLLDVRTLAAEALFRIVRLEARESRS